MGSTDYNVDLRDIHFVLFEELRVQETLKGLPDFSEFDEDFYRSILDEMTRISTKVIAPINHAGDHEGCHFDGHGNVTTPKGYREAFQTLAEGGWFNMNASPDHGGMGMPFTLGMAASEIRTGACVALSIYCGLTEGVGNLLVEFGSDEMKSIYVPQLYSGTWAGTMLLTEAGAGTDVGANRTKATRTDQEGVYLLEGEKIFISGGDHDLTENIIHIALARTPAAPAGTRGLSIFVVPKFLVNPDGSLGERNDIQVVGIEEKMGIHGSATCTIALGANGPCVGYRLGEEGDGFRIMLKLMNEARIMVGIQGLSTAAPAYLNALHYANERIQGTDIREMKNPDAPRVPIVAHPDVRRNLMTMKVLVETIRSFLYTTGFAADISMHHPDPKEREKAHQRLELMTPICKAHCSDMGFDVTCRAVQVFGGYGYIGEYPVEQYLRDNKISSIYEGTNGIQALDLLGRKLRMKGGALFMDWVGQASTEVAKAKKGPFKTEAEALEKSVETLGAAAMHLGQMAFQNKVLEAMLYASPFLTLFGHVLLGIHALRQAIIAQAALDSGAGSDEAFYKGKVLNLRFYVHNILPNAVALSKSIRSNDESCMDPSLFTV